jgi:hypothetical protein
LSISDTPTTTSSSLKSAGIKLLKAPGAESNHLDWNFVVELYLQDAEVSYTLSPAEPACHPASWFKENVAVCSLITRTVDPSNYCHIRDF